MEDNPLQDHDTSASISSATFVDQAVQVGEFPAQPYQCYEARKKSDIRTELIQKIKGLIDGYVHGDSRAVPELVYDLVHSKKWLSTFGLDEKKVVKEIPEKLLCSILKEYKECKVKETNSQIRKQGKKVQQAINISGTKSRSSIAFQGSTPDNFRSRTEAARSMGRLVSYSAERRRLLSIVASDYSQSYLTELFQCSKSTVTAARVHGILFGRGGVPPASFKFSRQCVTQEVLDQLADFLLRDDVSRPSSCRSVMVDGRECPVRYWQDSIKQVVKQYMLQFPDGVKRSYIYAHLPKNYRANTMLAGLCNLCEDFGYANFANLRELIQKMGADCQQQDLGSIMSSITILQRYLKTKFAHEVLKYNCSVMCDHENIYTSIGNYDCLACLKAKMFRVKYDSKLYF